MHLKICGLRDPAQARQVAALGVDAIGVIGVASSPRFVPASARGAVFAAIAATAPAIARVLVLADPTDADLEALREEEGATVLQLHGQESPERCREIRARLGRPLWKALRIREPADLERAAAYSGVVEALLLDAWVADQLGGTGARIPIDWLERFHPERPWWLAGGIRADGVAAIRRRLQPWGLDASSSVEDAPADKNVDKVRALVDAVRGADGDPALPI